MGGALGCNSEQPATGICLVGKCYVRPTVKTGGDAERPLYEVPFSDVISVNYSHGRDPVWNSPDGPALVVHARGGTLAMLGVSVQRDWVSLETSTDTASAGRFIVLQVDDQAVGPVLAALEERTGRAPQIVQR